MDIVCIGEVLWDIFPTFKTPGGAPANVAYHCQMMGINTTLLSRIGKNNQGNSLCVALQKKRISTSELQIDDTYPTGSVHITLKDREPTYSITKNVAWDYLAYSPQWKKITQSAKVICLGTLASRNQTSQNTIIQLLNNCLPNTTIFLDLNFRPPYISPQILTPLLNKAHIIKGNQEEWARISELYSWKDPIREILSYTNCHATITTMGEKGAKLHSLKQSYTCTNFPSSSIKTGDCVGLGDAFSAAFCVSIALEEPYPISLEKATKYATKMVGYSGSMPDYS